MNNISIALSVIVRVVLRLNSMQFNNAINHKIYSMLHTVYHHLILSVRFPSPFICHCHSKTYYQT